MYCLVYCLPARKCSTLPRHRGDTVSTLAKRTMFYSSAFSAEDLPRRRRAQAPSDNLRVGPDMAPEPAAPWASGPSAPESPPPQRDRRAPGHSVDAPSGGYAGQDASQGLSYKERLAAERKVSYLSAPVARCAPLRPHYAPHCGSLTPSASPRLSTTTSCAASRPGGGARAAKAVRAVPSLNRGSGQARRCPGRRRRGAARRCTASRCDAGRAFPRTASVGCGAPHLGARSRASFDTAAVP